MDEYGRRSLCRALIDGGVGLNAMSAQTLSVSRIMLSVDSGHAMRQIAKRVELGLQVLARATGHDLVRKHFYSPLPDVDRLASSLWSGASEMPGLDLRFEEALAFLQQDLWPYLSEFSPPIEDPCLPGAFFINNGSYGSVDAELLYAILRYARPSRVVELGSGASSHVINAARRASAANDHPFEHIIFDPYPFTANPMGPVSGPTVHKHGVEDLDIENLVSGLTDRDVLFVDTTHTVKTGGDVVRIVLEILPRLAPGVWVHLHDIFLPYEYPREWVVKERRAWAEQYLLQAFLAFNRSFDVVLPAYALSVGAPETIRKGIASFRPGVRPGAFWVRRTG